jgi:hypothetical protein
MGTNNIFTVAYLGSFDPNNICTNYLADEGSSPNPENQFSFNLNNGQTVVLVVSEVTSGAGCSSYTMTVSGVCFSGTPSPTPTATPTATPIATPTVTPTVTHTATQRRLLHQGLLPDSHQGRVRPHILARKDHRGVSLISDVLPFGGLWYGKLDETVEYAQFYSRSSGHHSRSK